MFVFHFSHHVNGINKKKHNEKKKQHLTIYTCILCSLSHYYNKCL